MKIKKLIIRKLHGFYDYDVDFEDNVTFLYGANGCGKTTILDIVASIITGEINKLFQYKFETIDLYCNNSKKNNELTSISIFQKDRSKLIVKYRDKKCEIDVISEAKEYKKQKDLNKLYFDYYPILDEIRNIFNYVYLPLNRSSSVFASTLEERDYFVFKRRYLNFEEKIVDEHQDHSLEYVESLVMAKVLSINSNISAINDNFRNDIFKSFLSEFRNVNFMDIIKELDKDRTININQIKNDFIEIVKTIDLWSSSHEEQINNFFEDINKMHNEYNANQSNSASQGIKSDLIFGYTKIMQVKEILKLANKMEESKNKTFKPVENFLKTVNEFIGFSGDGKKIEITREGRIYFTNRYSKEKINISNLSSGEKQLITFFSYLIFGVKQNKSGIFIVDEPELSLHLAWQKIFVEKVLELNGNVQLIFATHSPEIIGKYRENTYKLVKKTDKGELRNE